MLRIVNPVLCKSVSAFLLKPQLTSSLPPWCRVPPFLARSPAPSFEPRPSQVCFSLGRRGKEREAQPPRDFNGLFAGASGTRHAQKHFLKPPRERGAGCPVRSCAFAWSRRSRWPPQLVLWLPAPGAQLHPECSARAQLRQVCEATVRPGSAGSEAGRSSRLVLV